MWLMMRGHRDDARMVTPATAKSTAMTPAAGNPRPLTRLDALYLHLGEVTTRQATLAKQLALLESTEGPGERGPDRGLAAPAPAVPLAR